MVSKKLLKNKVPVSNNRKINNNKKKKAIFVSQKVIISSILDKSLIDTKTRVILPGTLSSIYQEMISDVSYINDTLKKKDYSFYGCNLGFVDGEQMISSKRQALVEFMMKKENTNGKSHKIDKIKEVKIDRRKSKRGKEKTKEIVSKDKTKKITEKETAEKEKDSELSSENNSVFRPQRKREKPSKFKNEDLLKIKKEDVLKEENKVVEEDVKEKENIKSQGIEETQTKLGAKDPKSNKKIKLKKGSSEVMEIIDLIEDNSSDSSEYGKGKSMKNSNSVIVNQIGKSKVYFREPVTRKPTKLINKQLKEHTLLDKILLGINCVRKWTEKGLHLSRLCETDLALLNKRLTSLNCILADLQEHTDENNNRYLSVLLKSDLFSSFIVPGQSQKTSEGIQGEVIPAVMLKDPNEQQENLENVAYNRPKTKLHIPSMYRQRHGLPGILSKPQIKPTESKTNFNESSSTSTHKTEDLPHSLVKFEEQSSINPNTVATSAANDVGTEPQLTASQILRMKSQKSIVDVNQKCIVQTVPEPPVINNPCGTQLSRFTMLSNGIVMDNNQAFFYQTTNLHQRTPFPMYLLSNTTLMPTVPNNNIQRQIRVPLTKAYHTITRIPLQSNGLQNNSANHIQQNLSQIQTKTNTLSSKSVVLKNLLQQSNAQIVSANAVSTNQMVPLSVFQNSQTKRQFVPINQQLFHNK